eukprot:5429302-Pleurochrysis_carterae.AAC.1
MASSCSAPTAGGTAAAASRSLVSLSPSSGLVLTQAERRSGEAASNTRSAGKVSLLATRTTSPTLTCCHSRCSHVASSPRGDTTSTSTSAVLVTRSARWREKSSIKRISMSTSSTNESGMNVPVDTHGRAAAVQAPERKAERRGCRRLSMRRSRLTTKVNQLFKLDRGQLAR